VLTRDDSIAAAPRIRRARKVARAVSVQRRKVDAHRARTYRQRQRDGERIYRLSLNDDAIAAMIESCRLSEQQALDHQQCEQALAEIIGEWTQRWLR